MTKCIFYSSACSEFWRKGPTRTLRGLLGSNNDLVRLPRFLSSSYNCTRSFSSSEPCLPWPTRRRPQNQSHTCFTCAERFIFTCTVVSTVLYARDTSSTIPEAHNPLFTCATCAMCDPAHANVCLSCCYFSDLCNNRVHLFDVASHIAQEQCFSTGIPTAKVTFITLTKRETPSDASSACVQGRARKSYSEKLVREKHKRKIKCITK